MGLQVKEQTLNAGSAKEEAKSKPDPAAVTFSAAASNKNIDIDTNLNSILKNFEKRPTKTRDVLKNLTIYIKYLQ